MKKPAPEKEEAHKAEQALVDGSAWADFCDQLKRAGQQVLRPETPGDAFTRAEGFRYLSRLVRVSLEAHVEFHDGSFPVLYMPSHETVKIGADNPDNCYLRAVLDPRWEYRIHGSRGSVHYLAFSTKGGDYSTDGLLEPTGFIDSRQLEIAADGSFELFVGQSKRPGNWLPMTERSASLLVRQTFLDREREQPAQLAIERVAAGDAPQPLQPLQLAAGLKRAAGFVEGTARLFADWAESYLARPNVLPPADQDLCQSVGGDPTIFYYHGYWQLQPEEALLIEVERIPECETWNFQLNNYWMESLDYRYHRIHLNRHSAVYKPDGGVRLVVAHRDPGVPNWLSTAGHALGTCCFRWIGAREFVHPQTRVVALGELG